MSDGDTLPKTTWLLRVLQDKPVHVAPGRREPTLLAFEPSSADRAHQPVRVSVWDERVTLARAKEIRGGGELVGFVLLAADVDQVARDFANPRVRAVEDPSGARGCLPDEARWHCGIEGLESEAWQGQKKARQLALRALANACEPAEEWSKSEP